MARSGGALPQLARPVRFGLGAVLGSGKQWVSWIHIADLIRLFEFAIDTPTCRGAVNAVAPAAATHAQMQRLLAKTLHRPLWMHIPAIFIRAALGEMSQLLVDGQRVAPIRALAAGSVFKFPNLRRGPGASARAAPANNLTPRRPFTTTANARYAAPRWNTTPTSAPYPARTCASWTPRNSPTNSRAATTPRAPRAACI